MASSFISIVTGLSGLFLPEKIKLLLKHKQLALNHVYKLPHFVVTSLVLSSVKRKK